MNNIKIEKNKSKKIKICYIMCILLTSTFYFTLLGMCIYTGLHIYHDIHIIVVISSLSKFILYFFKMFIIIFMVNVFLRLLYMLEKLIIKNRKSIAILLLINTLILSSLGMIYYVVVLIYHFITQYEDNLI